MLAPQKFCRELVPSPATFYKNEFGPALGRERRGWSQTRCPFHDGKSKTSLSVNLSSGGFYCFSCQAKGGGVIDFVMRRDKLNFKAAAQSVGAWKAESFTDRTARVQREHLRQLERTAEVETNEKIRQVRIEYAAEVRLYGRAIMRPETMPASLELLRRATAAHVLLDFGAKNAQLEFLNASPGERERIIEQILFTGYVTTCDGHKTAVPL